MNLCTTGSTSSAVTSSLQQQQQLRCVWQLLSPRVSETVHKTYRQTVAISSRRRLVNKWTSLSLMLHPVISRLMTDAHGDWQNGATLVHVFHAAHAVFSNLIAVDLSHVYRSACLQRSDNQLFVSGRQCHHSCVFIIYHCQSGFMFKHFLWGIACIRPLLKMTANILAPWHQN